MTTIRAIVALRGTRFYRGPVWLEDRDGNWYGGYKSRSPERAPAVQSLFYSAVRDVNALARANPNQERSSHR